ncbi:flagellar protein FlaG [Pseudoalteromonas 'SMAR']|uniref:flagellar protein FlaG n=1 Tax=Pseudoalteromonas 'SMAR' TaxID=3416908 RepID=UPI003AF2EF64
MSDVNSTHWSAESLTSPSSKSLVNNTDLKNEDRSKGAEVALLGAVDSKQTDQLDSNNKQRLIADVKNNLEKLNEYLPVTSTNLVFEFDESGEPPIIKVLDKKSEEVIREIPSEEFREVAKALDEFADKLISKGLLFDKTT